jgi:A/G-specific adenine glycosylase
MRTGFRQALLRWYDSGKRDLPWRRNRDWYPVWISEIMLQQTRAAAVIPYYLRFLELFPSIEALAAADEPVVLNAWSGLGYYSRARLVHRAAKQMAKEGIPTTHEGILALPGIGPYTAGAIASIALELPHAAVDGNVIRVISRLTNNATDISAATARADFASQAQELLDPRRPGDFNQAMMELGATVCVPRTPQCPACPVAKFCAARNAGTERQLPIRRPKPQPTIVPLDLLLVRRGDSIYLVQRSEGERRLAGFWELPEKSGVAKGKSGPICEFRHRIVNDIFEVTVWESATSKAKQGRWVELTQIAEIPLTTITKKALAAAGFC